MKPYTKKALIHFILSFVALALGIAVFILISGSIFDSMNQPVNEDAALAELGKALAAIAGIFIIVIVGIIDAVFTSMFVYMFAYFSNNNAKYAIEVGGDTTSTPKTIKILSLIEMILAAIIAIVGGLLIIGIFAFM